MNPLPSSGQKKIQEILILKKFIGNIPKAVFWDDDISRHRATVRHVECSIWLAGRIETSGGLYLAGGPQVAQPCNLSVLSLDVYFGERRSLISTRE